METGINISIKIPIWLDIIFAWPVMVWRRCKYGYDYRRIYLGEDEWAIVDQQDYYRLGNFKWHVTGTNSRFYAVRQIKVDNTHTTRMYLHREIMNSPKGMLVDHKDGNSFDNRRANLRLATRFQNSCNKRKRANTSSRFIGVYWDKAKRKWVARIKYQGKSRMIGNFVNEIAAAQAYDAAANKYRGEFARLNFPPPPFCFSPQCGA
ncbi:MAG: HNH endonuclease [Phycisphaerae bacterium]|jgi:hypothetical protein